jgi:transcriptional regulator with XRE-family HTH domain
MPFEAITIKAVKTSIGDWVKSLRKAQNLSQDELAVLLNLSRLTIQNLEAGKNITLDTLLKVLQHFDVMDRFAAFIHSENKNTDLPSLY